MRRLAALLLLLVPAVASGAPGWQLSLEGGSELDSNVHRAPQGSGAVAPALAARAGARLGASGEAGAHASWALDAVGAARAFPGADARPESVGVAAVSGRADLLAGTLAPGLRLAYTDVFGDAQNALALRTGDAAAALTLRAPDDVQVGALAGWRIFTYKPDAAFGFDGPHAGLSVGQRRRAEDGARQLAWTAAYSAGQRRYGSEALVDRCARGAPVTPTCVVVAGTPRSDLFHDLALDVTYTGSFIAGARLAVQLDDSNSFGQSLVRGRLELSGTTELLWKLVVTAKVVLQIDAYLDGLLLGGDLGTFTTIEDEARNALILHVTRELDSAWTLEARVASFASAFADRAVAYDRQVVYLGVVYTFNAEPW